MCGRGSATDTGYEDGGEDGLLEKEIVAARGGVRGRINGGGGGKSSTKRDAVDSCLLVTGFAGGAKIVSSSALCILCSSSISGNTVETD